MRTVTLSQIRTDVIDQADLVNVDSTSFITTTLLNRWIVQSSRAYFGMILRPDVVRYFESTQSISVVSGTAAYALDAEVFQVYGVEVTQGGNTFPIYSATPEQRAYGMDGDADGDIRPRYLIVGQSIEFVPVPSENYTAVMRYAPTDVVYNSGGSAIDDLSADTDYLDGVNGWEQWIVWDVCIKAAIKQEMDPSSYQAQKMDIERKIERVLGERDRAPKRVRDTYSSQAADWAAEGWWD